jgi:protein kinase A
MYSSISNFENRIIQSKPYGKPVDWWSIGILTYEMSTGRPPFQSDQPMKIYEKILATKYKIPSYLSDEIKDFMKCLIQPDVTKRYGNLKNGADDVKTHKWLANVDWLGLYHKKIQAPFIPKIKSPGDTSNFENYKEEAIPQCKDYLFQNEFVDF